MCQCLDPEHILQLSKVSKARKVNFNNSLRSSSALIFVVRHVKVLQCKWGIQSPIYVAILEQHCTKSEVLFICTAENEGTERLIRGERSCILFLLVPAFLCSYLNSSSKRRHDPVTERHQEHQLSRHICLRNRC